MTSVAETSLAEIRGTSARVYNCTETLSAEPQRPKPPPLAREKGGIQREVNAHPHVIIVCPMEDNLGRNPSRDYTGQACKRDLHKHAHASKVKRASKRKGDRSFLLLLVVFHMRQTHTRQSSVCALPSLTIYIKGHYKKSHSKKKGHSKLHKLEVL